MNTIAIVGIHTGIGKTIASAVIAEALGADYWKPVQAGIEERDAALLSTLLTNGPQRVHPEAVLLKNPLSPHAAAEMERVTIDYTTFTWPTTSKTLIVETAGGVLSPISAHHTMADFVAHYHLPTILVTQHYLGSINHTLLCIELLKQRNIPLLGLVINGEANEASESFITSYIRTPVIARIPQFTQLTNQRIAAHAAQIATPLQQIIHRATEH